MGASEKMHQILVNEGNLLGVGGIARPISVEVKPNNISALSRYSGRTIELHGAEGRSSQFRHRQLVRRTMRGVRRTYGKPQRRAAALTTDDVLAMTFLLGNSLAELRDRALLLLGFAGGFRRSELVSIDCGAVRRCVHGLVIMILKSKSDQESCGRQVVIPYGRMMCPVNALDAWLSASGITDGPVFRQMRKGGRLGTNRLSPEAVADHEA
jgi:hypothetical protein